MAHPSASDRKLNANLAMNRPSEQNSSPWVAMIAVVGVIVAVVTASFGYWLKGAIVAGSCFVFAGLARLVLPERIVGVLAVRKKWFDTLILLGVGVMIIVVGLVIPPTRG